MNKSKFINVPVQLQRSPDWLTWRYQPRNERLTKKPNIFNNKPGETWDDKALLTFSEAVAEYEVNPDSEHNPKSSEGLQEFTIANMEKSLQKTIAADGIGFAFRTFNDIAGIDLDHAIDDKGNITPTAMAVINAARGCYIETSVSGHGFHIYGICDKSKLIQKYGKSFTDKSKGIEVYLASHYFTVTGVRFMAGWGSIENAIDTCYKLKNGNNTEKASVASIFAPQPQTLSQESQRSGEKEKASVAAISTPRLQTLSQESQRSGEFFDEQDILRLPALPIRDVQYYMEKNEPQLANVLKRGYAAAPSSWGAHADGTIDKSQIDMKAAGLLANWFYRYGIETIISIFKNSALHRQTEKSGSYVQQTCTKAYNRQKSFYAAVDYRRVDKTTRAKVEAWTQRNIQFKKTL